jgi:hypothetical protein
LRSQRAVVVEVAHHHRDQCARKAAQFYDFVAHCGWIISTGCCAVIDDFGGGVSAYTIDSKSGALTPVTGSPFLAGTAPISVTTTGKFQF